VIRVRSETEVDAPVEEVFQWCTSMAGFTDQFPFAVRWHDGPEQWKAGDTLDFSYRVAGKWLRHAARVIDLRTNELFIDEMTDGLYGSFRHTHRFEPIDGGRKTRVIDDVELTLGKGALIDRTIGAKSLQRTFTKRHRALRRHFEEGLAHGR
jgi:ligand-binding SRPBCC domain-containing protein